MADEQGEIRRQRAIRHKREELAARILELRDDGLSIRKIADKVECSKSHVFDVIKRGY